MMNIQSIVNPLNPTPQAERGALGTEGFDFLTYLLGQRATQPPEWWQTDAENPLLDLPSRESTRLFGKAAEEPGECLLWQTAVTVMQPQPLAPPGLTIRSGLSLAEPVLPNGPARANVVEQRPLLALLQIPVEGMEPAELKQLVSKIWSDVKEVKVERLPEAMHSEEGQHAAVSLMVRLASKDDGNRSQVSPADSFSIVVPVKEEPPLSVTGPMGGSEPLVVDGKTKAGKRLDPEGFVVAQGKQEPDRLGLAESITKPEAPMVPAHEAKLISRVISRVENLVQQGGGKVTLFLDPPEMGRLTIEVTTRGKQVELAIHSDSGKTRELLESGMADLKLAMQSQDLDLARAQVHTTSESPLASMHFGQGNASHFESPRQQERGAPSWEDRAFSRKIFVANPLPPVRVASGLVDVRV